MSSNLFAHFAQNARFLGPWKRRNSKSGVLQDINLERDFHRPKPDPKVFNKNSVLTSPTDIENFKEALFALVMTMGHAKSKDMEDKNESLEKGVPVNLKMIFHDGLFHPEVELDRENLLSGFQKIATPDDANDGAIFYSSFENDKSGFNLLGIDTTTITSDDDIIMQNPYVLNAIAIFESGIAALSCYD